MKRLVIASGIALAIVAGILPPSTTVAAAPLSPEEIIQREGQFVFTYNDSFFVFLKDNIFASVPVNGLSGQTISGRWRRSGRDWVVEGRWGWINGISAVDDFRRMAIQISSVEPTGGKLPAQVLWLVPGSAPAGPARAYNVYKASFTIQELMKIGPPAGMEPTRSERRLPVRQQSLSATASGVLATADWEIWRDREFVVRLGFAPVPTGAPEPPRPVTQVWLLKADGTVIPATRPPDEVGSTSDNSKQVSTTRVRIYQYPLSARDEAVSVTVRVGDDYFTDRVFR